VPSPRRTYTFQEATVGSINEGASGAVTGELFRASGVVISSSSDTVTAGTVNAITGVAGAIDLSQVSNGLLVVQVTAISGTSPTLAVFVDVKDGNGNWVTTSNSTSISGAAITATGVYAGVISVSNAGGTMLAGATLTANGRIRWTLGGTGSPSATVNFSLWGR
jgi:hypothetical protein